MPHRGLIAAQLTPNWLATGKRAGGPEPLTPRNDVAARQWFEGRSRLICKQFESRPGTSIFRTDRSPQADEVELTFCVAPVESPESKGTAEGEPLQLRGLDN